MTPTHTHRDAGYAAPFIVVLAIALIAVVGLVWDAGRALSDRTEAATIAQAAARAGVNQLDLTDYRTDGTQPRIDPAAAETAALAWITSNGLTGTATATPESITVTVTVETSPQLLSIIGVGPITGTSTATATVHHGEET
ncbi:putative Flp pilus-assembly TadE/G-like protein [Stackebrandtia endophytica]|uniref:Putative Flp pilus-assembly TadE/G-like protein n=1 Tax=Stackebrandtia endophytica TaxID=1496996 RepID=A0A543AS04_9ACTN|nr:pilus assembly protein TadG-related protein [Stackebrandtia endophytica]TQL75361.1 putative Flp pilus-assembly TadE/G-like protein [Stackebrandtia endophytica]